MLCYRNNLCIWLSGVRVPIPGSISGGSVRGTGAAPVGHSRFQPNTAGSSRFQPYIASHSQFQLDPTAHCKARLSCGGHHRETQVKKGKKSCTGVRRTKWKNYLITFSEKGVGEAAPGHHSRFTCSPWRRPWRSAFILKDCSLWEAPTLKQRRNERRKKHWEELLFTDHNPGSHPTVPLRVEEDKEMGMQWCWAWCEGRTEFCPCYHLIFNFNWQKIKFPQAGEIPQSGPWQ